MQDLRQFLDSITLSLKENGVSRDIRRIILSQCIVNEYLARHRSNCIGPAYSALSLMMLKPRFAQAYIIRIAQEAQVERRTPPSGLMTPVLLISSVLLTRAGTDFLLETGLLTAEQLPMNHPSENLGILGSVAMYTSLLVEYINLNKLVNPNQKGYFVLDERLRLVFGQLPDNIGSYLPSNDEGERFHLKFNNFPMRVAVRSSRPRHMNDELTQRLALTHDYVSGLTAARKAKREAKHQGAVPLE